MSFKDFKENGDLLIKSTYASIYKLDQSILKLYHRDSFTLIEGALLSTLCHPSMATSSQIIYNQGLIMPYYPYKFSQLPAQVDQMERVLFQLLSLIEYLGSYGLIHRDLKPDNILMDSQGYLKVIDFGLASYQHPSLNHQVGTMWYRAPEILLQLPYNYKSDLWSLGCLMVEPILGHVLFKESNSDQMLNKIKIFHEQLRRFKNILKINPTLHGYQPRWPFLKDLKTIYLFSQKFYDIIINLLEFEPDYRRSPNILIQKYLSHIKISNKRKSYQPSLSLITSPLSCLSSADLYRILNRGSIDLNFKSLTQYSLPKLIINPGSWVMDQVWTAQNLDKWVQCTTLWLTLKPYETQIQGSFDLFTLCEDIIHQLNDPETRYFESYPTEVYQSVIDLCGGDLKPHRQWYHSSLHSSRYLCYHTTYNLLYLIYPRIRGYNYHYVVAHLQCLKSRNLSNRRLHFQTNPDLVKMIIHGLNQLKQSKLKLSSCLQTSYKIHPSNRFLYIRKRDP